MAATKTVLVFMLIGAVLGAAVASFLVPPILSWYNEPGAIAPSAEDVQTLCNLPQLIRYTSNRLLVGQLIGASVGAVVAIFPGLAVVRRRARVVAVAAPAA